MNLLLSCIGRRGYIAEWFREHLEPGERIVGTSNTTWTPGFHGCDKAVLMPDVRSDQYIPALLNVCRAEKIDAVLSFFDLDVDIIARHRDLFVDLGIVPIIPEAEVSAISLDKVRTAHFLNEHGFVTPATFATLDEAQSALADRALEYPVIVKARCGFASKNLSIARNDNEMTTAFHQTPNQIIQQFLPGQEHSLDVLNDLKGRVVSVIVKQKMLMRSGETDQAATVHHPQALELGVRLGQALGHVGPLDVDLFIDGDQIAILELNPASGVPIRLRIWPERSSPEKSLK